MIGVYRMRVQSRETKLRSIGCTIQKRLQFWEIQVDGLLVS
jgi:hypothetical protein